MGKYFYFFPLFALVIFTGCNIFSWTWSEDRVSPRYENYEDIFANRINSGRYEDAMRIAQMMIDLDSTRSEGYFYKAKAARYHYFNKFFVIQELIKREQEYGATPTPTGPNSVPFLDLDVFVQESIYVGNRIIRDNLYKIYYEETTSGRYEKQHVAFDYFIANSVYAILNLRDLHGDGSVLNDSSFFADFRMVMTPSGLAMENFDSFFNRISRDTTAFNNMLSRTANILEESFSVSRGYLGGGNESVTRIDSVLTIISENLESLKINDSIINQPNIILN